MLVLYSYTYLISMNNLQIKVSLYSFHLYVFSLMCELEECTTNPYICKKDFTSFNTCSKTRLNTAVHYKYNIDRTL